MTLLLWILAAIATATLGIVRRRLQRLEAAMHQAEREREAAQAREAAQTERERFSKELSLALQREESVEDFGRVLLATLARRIDAKAGAMHALDEAAGEYRLAAGYAQGTSPAFVERYRPGEGVAGQAAVDRRSAVLVVDAPDWMRMAGATADAAAVALVVAPVVSADRVPAVLEFALPGRPEAEALASLEEALPIVALSLDALLARLRTLDGLMRAQALEERQRRVLAHLGEGIFGQDMDGRVTFVNAAALRMLGYDEADLLGQPMHAKTHHHYPDGRPFPRESCPVYETARDGVTRTVSDQVFWRKDGTPLPVEYTAAPITDLDGRPDGAVISFRDLTETLRQRHELEARDRRLAENEAKLRTIFETGTEGIWVIDNDLRTTDVNPAMARLLGRPREDVLGRTIFEFVDDSNARIFREQIRRRQQGETGAYDIALSRPDGSQVLCLFNATPMFDAAGTRIGSFAMVADLTPRNAAGTFAGRPRG